MTKRKYAIYGMYSFETTCDDSPRGTDGPSEHILIKLTYEEVIQLGKMFSEEDPYLMDYEENMDIIDRVRKKMVREDGYTEEESWQFQVVWSDDLKFDCIEYYEEYEKDNHIEEIRKALAKGDFKVTLYEPNNIEEYYHSDGSPYYLIMGDDAGRGVDFGSCEVEVLGHIYSCNLNTGEWEGDELLEYVEDDLEKAEGVYYGILDDMYDECRFYAKCKGIDFKTMEYHMYEDYHEEED